MQEPPAAPLWPRREGKTDMEAQEVMDPQPSADMSLAFGVLRGAVPFSGQCRVNGAFRDVTGKMYWSTQVPAPDEGTSGLDVAVYLHARDHEVDTAACEIRLECGEVRSLLAGCADTEASLLAAAMENARARGQGEFDVRIAR